MPRIYGTNPPKYTDLSDVPASFSGDANKVVAVNGTESGLEHRDLTATDIPNLDAAKITTGTLDAARIPSLPASQLTSGVLDVARIPSLPASQITTGKLSVDRIGATGTPSSTTYYRGDDTWATIASGVVTVQSEAPTETTNAVLGAQIYATSDSRKYLCIDATTNANIWAYWIRDGSTAKITFSTTGIPVDNASMEDASNQSFFRNGALYYLGTSGFTTAYSNVHTSGRVLATMSTVQAGSAANLMDRTVNQVYTNVVGGSWVRFDFGSRPFIATRIVWQHGFPNGQYRLQNYKYQGSNDATISPTNWTDIATYTSSPPANAAYSFKDDIFSNTTAFRHYRILSTGLTTNGDNSFPLTDIEFFGTTTYFWTF